MPLPRLICLKANIGQYVAFSFMSNSLISVATMKVRERGMEVGKQNKTDLRTTG